MSSQAAETTTTSVGRWMRANLTVQGYRLSDAERRSLWLGLRFSTGLCLALVVFALAIQSSAMLVALSGIGAIAGFSRRHPFDLLWNHGVRQLLGAPSLPPNPSRRRHAFKLATIWLLAVAALFTFGAALAALVLGGVLVAVCATVTVTNMCIPSLLLSGLERARARGVLQA